MIVFIYHYGGGVHSSIRAVRLFGFLNKGGWSGVTLFFVLSGFLITGILWDSFEQPNWWRNFYIRRILRIFPLYYGTIVLVLLAAAIAGTFRQAISLIWIPVLFLQNMPHLTTLVAHIASPLGLFHFWSLAVEEQFYLIWPFGLFFLHKSHRQAQAFCLATFLFSCVFRLLIWNLVPTPDQFSGFLLSRAGELAAGGWLALAWRGPDWSRVERAAPIVALAGLAGFLISGILAGSFEATIGLQMTLGLPCVTLFFAALLALSLRPGVVQRCAEAAWLRWLGGISYGIYVFHMLFLGVFETIAYKLLGPLSHQVSNAALLLIAAAGSLGTAWLSFHYFETQFLKLKDGFTNRVVRPVSEVLR